MTYEEIKKALQFGKETINEYKAENRAVPSWMYERQIELMEMKMELMERLLDE